MNDMSSVIVPRSDQWNSDDFLTGPRTFTITEVRITGGTEQPVSICLEGTDKFFRPCKSMSRVLVAAWGPDANQYVGRSLTLYRDPEVKWAGMAVGGIRISHMTHIERDMVMALTATKGSRKPHTVKPLRQQQQQTAPVNDDPAAGWADRYIAALKNALDVEDLAALRTKHAVKVAEMQAKRPDLYQRVIEADPASAQTAPAANPSSDEAVAESREVEA